MGVQVFLVILIVVGFSYQAQTVSPQNLTCDPNDLSAGSRIEFGTLFPTLSVLKDFMAGLYMTIDGWEPNSSSNCCKWPVITFNNETRKVLKLELGNKKLTGNLSESLGSLDQLRTLNLSHNYLKSSIPISLLNMSSLQVLDLSFNDFYGAVPDFVNLSSIQILDMSQNYLSGFLPDHICHAGGSELKILKLSANFFSGDLPSGIGNCAFLDHLHVEMNDLTGIPEGVFRLQNLSDLIISYNKLSGQLSDGIDEIPESYKDFHSLSYFSLSNSSNTNLLSALRILQQCKNLTTLVLSLNFHHEELPADPSFHFEKLRILVIANCRLKGDFDSLFYLDISNNSFTGEIPENITRLPSLIDREISLEEPSPDFPFFMKRIVSSRGLQYNQVQSFPPTLDLSSNNLSGPIWLEFGNLKKLHVLDLKLNNLSGSIPINLSGMSSLEALDLSHNMLSGTIPSSLVKLNFLSKFNVAYNKLHGEILSGGQFSTFPNSSFEGNDLCGDQAKPCSIIHNRHTEPHNKSRTHSCFNDGIAVGIAVGFVFGVALFQATSRHCGPFKKLWNRLSLPT
ncbi:Phytosulfokine receptor 1 [Morus notabilis]|uniref:Phytosulfokine receptor 1 n=1 Tax=Morus notabilis TaxID=981085 RepID=W9SDR7_9ROSA|nr:Phytosulfokine receptor 1 [Morus notabilis]